MRETIAARNYLRDLLAAPWALAGQPPLDPWPNISGSTEHMNRTSLVVVGALTVLAAAGVQAQSPGIGRLAEEREIAAVRTVVREVDRDFAAKRLMSTEIVPECDDSHDGVSARLLIDRTGRTRQLRWAGTTEHHGDSRYYYYDESGKLRFALAIRAADNGSVEEERAYYTAGGRLLRRLKTLKAGPGYPFHENKPIWEPAKWLRQPCPREG